MARIRDTLQVKRDQFIGWFNGNVVLFYALNRITQQHKGVSHKQRSTEHGTAMVSLLQIATAPLSTTWMENCELDNIYLRAHIIIIFRIANGKVPLPLPDSMNIDLGGKELGLDRPISQQEYLSGACFGNFGAPTAASLVTTPKYIATTSAFKPLKPSNPPTSVLRTHNTQKDDPPIETSSKRWSANWYVPSHTSQLFLNLI